MKKEKILNELSFKKHKKPFNQISILAQALILEKAFEQQLDLSNQSDVSEKIGEKILFKYTSSSKFNQIKYMNWTSAEVIDAVDTYFKWMRDTPKKECNIRNECDAENCSECEFKHKFNPKKELKDKEEENRFCTCDGRPLWQEQGICASCNKHI